MIKIIVLLPKKYQFKISDSCVDHGDYAHLEGGATPWGAWGQAVAAGRTPQPRKGLEGCEAATMHSHLRWLGRHRWLCIGAGARERGAPESPVFGAAENAPK
jgi:hypothetical protein